MRLLMLAPASAVHTQRWANGLATLGVDVHLACLVEHMSGLGTLDDRITTHPLRGHGQLAYFIQAPAVARLARRLRPDVVNAHYASGYGTVLRLSRLQPSVLSAWGSDVFEFPDRGRLHQALVDANLRFAREVTSSSEVMAARIAAVTRGAVTARVIPFGVDHALFRPATVAGGGRPLRFGIVKTLEPHYRIDVVVDAFARYLSARDRGAATLDIYGGGSLMGELQARASRLGVADRTIFHGPIPHQAVPDAVRAMDVFVLASETESFGVAAVEAMSCGVPVIASDAPGFCEVLDNGRYGLLYPRGDVDSLARLMGEVGDDVELRRRLRELGLDGAARYDWQRCLRQMYDLLEATARSAS